MRVVIERLFPFLIMLLVLTPFLLLNKIELMQEINQRRTIFLDALFLKASSLGNAITVLLVLPILLRFRLKWLAIFIIGFLIQAFIVILCKKGLFHGELRPLLFFRRSGLMHTVDLIPGLKVRHVNTFPSGHTATIFYLVSFFAILARNKVASWVLVVVGLFVGFSRIYLFQHWYADVYVGMFFGILSSVLAYLFVKNVPKDWHSKQLVLRNSKVFKNAQQVLKQLFN
ncbi:phosphatase PAP2 family protein [Croceivirga sp. JEA036]|uniref:phosphatase PAP2 family protein n=1 Tax=Croceivirga sp. JEA036 TaxID=2721162 RepID=UPI00143A21B0|nr:phosphatase PAP2 family protein [Croceivirga sp. JEA036]NJB34964.1 phosphatase PAP2 family protein [Croceivirga sp. JEA036]